MQAVPLDRRPIRQIDPPSKLPDAIIEAVVPYHGGGIHQDPHRVHQGDAGVRGSPVRRDTDARLSRRHGRRGADVVEALCTGGQRGERHLRLDLWHATLEHGGAHLAHASASSKERHVDDHLVVGRRTEERRRDRHTVGVTRLAGSRRNHHRGEVATVRIADDRPVITQDRSIGPVSAHLLDAGCLGVADEVHRSVSPGRSGWRTTGALSSRSSDAPRRPAGSPSPRSARCRRFDGRCRRRTRCHRSRGQPLG